MEEKSVFLFLCLVSLGAAQRGSEQVVEKRCGAEKALNATVFLPSLIANMDGTREQVRSTGFGISTNGSDHSLAQCYRGLPPLDCMLCYSTARSTLPSCFPFIGGRVYLDACFMRAEKYDFYSQFSGPHDTALCGGGDINVTSTVKGTRFAEAARRAVAAVAAAAPGAGGNATAVEGAGAGGGESVYVMADCLRSVNESGCRACLENASAAVVGCLPWSEGRALNTGCFLRYSDVNFLAAAAVSEGGSGGKAVVVILGAVGSLILLVVVGLAFAAALKYRKKKMKKRRDSDDPENIASTLSKTCVNFKYSTLEKATGSFDISNKVGQGGFGAVYKGVLADGREIAVKRLFFDKKYRASDFYNEANIISSVEHKNLVRLLGCSCSGPENLLVYEFLPNKSLNNHLFDPKKGKELTWEKRFRIIVGMARGLAYLHEESTVRIIHRDIKASNILLDSQLRPKIADFGLARFFQDDKTHVSTAIAGTIGYMAPEYITHGQLTEKADVYSFGVLLLEIITGKPNNSREATEYSDSLLNSAWKHFLMNRREELVDPNLMLEACDNETDKSDIVRVIHVALLCVQENSSLRPSISRALQMLLRKEEEQQLPTPTRPPFTYDCALELKNTIESAMTNSRPNCSSSSSQSIAMISHSSFHPR